MGLAENLTKIFYTYLRSVMPLGARKFNSEWVETKDVGSTIIQSTSMNPLKFRLQTIRLATKIRYEKIQEVAIGRTQDHLQRRKT